MPLPLGHQGHFHSNYHKETPKELANVNSESVEAFRFLLDQDNNWSCGSYLATGWQKHSMLGQAVSRKLRIFQRPAEPALATDQRERTLHPYKPHPRQEKKKAQIFLSHLSNSGLSTRSLMIRDWQHFPY